AATGQEQPLGGRTTLLAAIKLNALVDLDVQPGHDLARNFGNSGLVRVVRFFISAAQADKALFNLQFFRFGKGEPSFLGKILGDGVCSDIDATGIDAPLL